MGRWQVVGAAGLAALALAGCPHSPPPLATATPAPTPTPRPQGEPVGPAFYQAVMPPYRVGMAWTYRLAGPNGPQGQDARTVVKDLTATEAVLETTTGSHTLELRAPLDGTPPAAPRPGQAPLAFWFQGTDDVAVPAGTFKGARRVVAYESSSVTTAWYAAGTGLIKSEVKADVAGVAFTTVQELVKFEPGAAPQADQ